MPKPSLVDLDALGAGYQVTLFGRRLTIKPITGASFPDYREAASKFTESKDFLVLVQFAAKLLADQATPEELATLTPRQVHVLFAMVAGEEAEVERLLGVAA